LFLQNSKRLLPLIENWFVPVLNCTSVPIFCPKDFFGGQTGFSSGLPGFRTELSVVSVRYYPD